MDLVSGFAYLGVIIDWYYRRVLSWRISNTMEAVVCVDCLENATREHGKCETLTISMDGRGRAFDSIFASPAGGQ
jgi:putative transposase